MLKLPNGLLTARVDRLIQVWETWELFKKIKLVKGRIDLHLFLTLLGSKEKSQSPLDAIHCATCCTKMHGTSSESDRLIEVKTIKNNSLGTWKRWPRPLNTGDCLMQVSFTVIKGNDFRDFVKWPLNRGPLNTGVTVLSMRIFCFCLQYSILGVALSNRYCQFS